MITRQNGRKTFYQWDLDQKIAIADIEGDLDVHFFQEGQSEALVVTPTIEDGVLLATVPNILLQNALPLKIYIWRKDIGAWTAHQQIFQVLEREKPSDYIYTETGVKKWEVDQTYNPESENAQSGKAVAEAVKNAGGATPEQIEESVKEYLDENLPEIPTTDTRTPFEKFIDKYNLKQRNYVDLSVGVTDFYYTDFANAVSAINENTYATLPTTDNGNECRVFVKDGIVILQLLKDIAPLEAVVFTTSCFFDLNGHTITIPYGVQFGTLSNGRYDAELVYYGAKFGSHITTTEATCLVYTDHSNTWLIGGEYSMTIEGESKSRHILRIMDNTIDTSVQVVNAYMHIDSTRSYVNDIACIITRRNTNGIKLDILIENSTLLVEADIQMPYAFRDNSNYDAFDDEYNLIIKNSTLKSLARTKYEYSGIYPNDTAAVVCNCKNAVLVNSKIYGTHSGVSNFGVVYINSCEMGSPHHGGVYNAESGVMYAENSKFYQTERLDYFYSIADGTSYFSYGSVAYIDSCEFINEYGESGFSGWLAISKNNDLATRVYLSNCTIPALRCDETNYVYLGQGIADDIKNSTVDGTIVLTDEVYSTSNVPSSVFEPLDGLVMKGTADPTYQTPPKFIGQPYINTTTNKYFICLATSGGTYTWKELGSPSGGDGGSGEDGATFTPIVTEDGTIIWTNDKGLPNPDPVNIKGDKGDKGDSYVLTETDKQEIANMAVELFPVYEGEVEEV